MRLVHAVGLTSAALLAALLPAAAAFPTPSASRSASAPAVPEDCGPDPSGTCVRRGPEQRLGDGRVRVYTEYARDRPRAVGVELSAGALDRLPSTPTDGEHCHDADGDGVRDPAHECVGGHGRELALPATPPDRPALPFDWVLFNWNPHGHTPHGRYDVPHFDVHFYLVPPAERAAIRVGGCALMIDCGQLATASRPVPAAHLPAGYPASSPQTAEGAMGSHLDSRPPSTGTLAGQTLIYGAYGGRLIFIEPMLTKAFLERQRTVPGHRTCEPVPQPAVWRTPGWYPTRYCTAYRPETGAHTVSLTDFVRRSPDSAAGGGWSAPYGAWPAAYPRTR
ncbi:hypothetical protein [Streptomyces sp. NPDC086023]|uniref:hypothetical protein n=1 Tax=Streptomyces sp. NPDC086023 TaxID=3365746 RepID=UPI0037CDF314